MKTWITSSLAVVDSEEIIGAAFRAVKGGLIGRVTTLDEAREVLTRLGVPEAERDTLIANGVLNGG